MSKFALLIIDPQVDFHLGGSLPVNGADDDALRIAKFINENGDSISNIYVTLDSHQVRRLVSLELLKLWNKALSFNEFSCTDPRCFLVFIGLAYRPRRILEEC